MHSHEPCACEVTECCVNLYITLSVLGNSSTGGHSIVYSIFFYLCSEKTYDFKLELTLQAESKCEYPNDAIK